MWSRNGKVWRSGIGLSILKFVGRFGLGLFDIGLGQEIWIHVHLCGEVTGNWCNGFWVLWTLSCCGEFIVSLH